MPLEQHLKKMLLLILRLFIGRKPVDPSSVAPEGLQRILVVRQHDYLGDFLLATPVLRALRERFPDAHIALLARKHSAEALEHNDEFDEIILYRRRWDFPSARDFLAQLRSGWDLCIVLNTVSHSLTSDLLAWLSGARHILGPERVSGDGMPRNFLYDLRSPVERGTRHETLRNLDIVKTLGAVTSDPAPHVHLVEPEQEKARKTLERLGRRKGARLVGIHLGAGKTANRWPLTRFGDLAARLQRREDLQVLVTWGLGEGDLARSLLEKSQARCLWGAAPPLRELASLFAECDALVCNDTGMLHLAAAVGTPVVGVFGPTDPERFCPIGDLTLAVKSEDRRVGSVTVEDVMKALDRLPKQRPPSKPFVPRVRKPKEPPAPPPAPPVEQRSPVAEAPIPTAMPSSPKPARIVERRVKKTAVRRPFEAPPLPEETGEVPGQKSENDPTL